MTEMPLTADRSGLLPAAVDRFFEYLQDGIAVNRGIAVKWARAWGSPAKMTDVAVRAPAEFAAGHGRAIGTWLGDETVLAQQGLADSFTAATERVGPGTVTDLGDRRAAASTRD